MNCGKCNALVPDDAAFCPECGSPVEAPAVMVPTNRMFCPNCGAELQGSDVFCGNCGERLTMPPAQPKRASRKQKIRTKKKIFRKRVLFLGAVLAILLISAILATSVFAGSDSYAVYIKDNQLQYGELPKFDNAQELTNKLFDDKKGATPFLSDYIRMTDDGKKLFYPDRIEYNEYGSIAEVTLYYRNINNPKKDAVKIDSGISAYEINKNGAVIYYLKNGNLYRNDLKDKVKIDSDVASFRLSEDERSLLYFTTYAEESDGNETYNAYLMNNERESEKLLSGITDLQYASKDFSTLVFTKNDSLYVKNGSENAIKIASDISDVYHVSESGEIYYGKMDQEEITYWDLIEDDMVGTEYSENYAEYLMSCKMSNPVETLYYYNGKDSVIVAENMIECEYLLFGWEYLNSDRAIAVYTCYDGETLPRLKLSEYMALEYSFSSWLQDALEERSASYVAVGGVPEELDVGELYDVKANAEGSVLYVAADVDYDSDCVAMYRVVLSDTSVESCELLDDEVNKFDWRVIDDSLLYFKEVTEDEGELYLDGILIDDDVYSGYFVYDEKHNKLYYMKDWNADKELCTLMCYDGQECVTIKEDVYQFIYTVDDSVLLLCDYNRNYHKGELWIMDNGKSRKLDDDVNYIVFAN